MTRVRAFPIILIALALGLALAVGTPAGEQIKNQATAKYVDSSGDPQITNSNQVITIVKQIFGLSVSPDGEASDPGQTQDATPGSTVYFPYTVTNTGNGTDSFALSSLINTDDTGTISATTPVFYEDSNGNGVVDTGEPVITSVADLTADTPAKIIMAYLIPSSADAGDTVIATPVATSQNDPFATDTDPLTVPVSDGDAGDASDNYHQTNVVQDAVMLPSKAVDNTNTSPTDTLTFTITATNTGSLAATNVVISDAIPAGTTIVTGSGVATPTATVTETTSNVSVTFASVAKSQTVKLVFQVQVDSAAALASAGISTINNTATVDYDQLTDSDPLDADPEPLITNTTDTVVDPTFDLDLGPKDDPTNLTAVSYTSEEGYTVTSAIAVDAQVVASANAGDSVSFINSVVNNGTDDDIFNLVISTTGLNLPSGASVVLTTLDGTPLSDNDGDGVLDSGPVAPGVEFDFIVKILVPATAADADGATTVHSVVVTATSSEDSTKSDPTTNTIEDIKGPDVSVGTNTDIPVNDPNAATPNPGDGTADSAAGIAESANPGDSVSFPVDVGNTGGNQDNYDLEGTITFTDPDGNPITVPVVYYPPTADTNADGELSPTEIAAATPISNTGDLDPDEEITVFAVVEVPENSVPTAAPSAVEQTVSSPNSGTTADFDLDTVAVNLIAELKFSPNRNGTVPSPGTVIYQHTVTNSGNVDIIDIDITDVAGGNTTGWTQLYSYDAVTYYPATSLPAVNLIPGASSPLYVKVNAPAGVPQGATNVLDISAEATFDAPTGTNPTDTKAVTDTTIVISGEITVDKEWSLDGTNWFKGDGSDTGTVPEVAPGSNIFYRVIVANIGTDNVSGIELNDPIPAFTDFFADDTTYTAGTECSSNGGSTYAACAATGTIDASTTTVQFDIGTLAPGASSTFAFQVTVQ